jgi:hypothetical protein
LIPANLPKFDKRYKLVRREIDDQLICIPEQIKPLRRWRPDHNELAYALCALVASALIAISIGRPWLAVEKETEEMTFATYPYPTWGEHGEGILLKVRPPDWSIVRIK